MRKTYYNPYAALKAAFQGVLNKQHARITKVGFWWTRENVDPNAALVIIRERVRAAHALGYETVVEMDVEKLTFIFREKVAIPSVANVWS